MDILFGKESQEGYTYRKVLGNTVPSSTAVVAINIILLPLKSIVKINEHKVLW